MLCMLIPNSSLRYAYSSGLLVGFFNYEVENFFTLTGHHLLRQVSYFPICLLTF